MSGDELLSLLSRLDPGAHLTISVPVGALAEALQAREHDPDMVVGTGWLSEHLGMSRAWWANMCAGGHLPAFQEAEGAPWRCRVGDAVRALEVHMRPPPKQEFGRGPWKQAGTP